MYTNKQCTLYTNLNPTLFSSNVLLNDLRKPVFKILQIRHFVA